MTEKERFERVVGRFQPTHPNFFERPHLTRRGFFRDSLTGLAGSFLWGRPVAGETVQAGSVQTRGTAKNVIFLFLRGAPSQVDTFDFKYLQGVTPSDFGAETFGGVTVPMALLGNTSRVLDKIAIIRSGLAWARAHPLGQSWVQIGRNPTSVTGAIAPHIGSVVALEKEAERRPDQTLPGFIALRAGNIAGSGYLPPKFGPLRVEPSAGGLRNADHPGGESAFRRRWALLEQMEAGLRNPSAPAAGQVDGLPGTYADARRLVFNPAVSAAFSYTQEEHARYGATRFGDAVLTARKIVEQDQGTRFIQVELGSWDHHTDIYGEQEEDSDAGIYARAAEFDPAFAALIEDLDASGRLSETLVLVCGEFGRTPGPLSNLRRGRDHYLQMFFVLAGGGVQGGTVIGATNETGGKGPGSFTTEYGWSRQRDIRPEDIEATIYSALGIDWTKVRLDDPLGRGFPYVPLSAEDAYAPVDELWG